jgi:signal transduction histidine kinase
MRRRIVVAIVAVAAASVVLFAIPLAIVQQRELRDQELVRLQRDAVAATRAIDVPGQPGDPVEVPRSRDRLAVYGTNGRLITGVGPRVADAAVRSALRFSKPTTAQRGGRLIVAVPVLAREHVIAALRASRSTGGVDADVRRRLLIVVAIALGVIVAAALAALAVARRLVRPIDRLSDAAARLGDGDFSARAPRAGVAELDAVAATLDSTAQRLEDLLQRERAFTADASHQLRTPLAALRLELETLELEGLDVARPLEQVDRLEATIDTLLAVARDVPLDRGEIDLVALVDGMEPTWRSRLALDGRPLHVQVLAPAVAARAAAPVVEHITDVLLDNAHRHGEGAVTMTVRSAPGGAALDVGDCGSGLQGDPEAAFARRAGSGNGHGIGLSLARSLAQAEHGRLIVTRPGPNPVFTLLLPPPSAPLPEAAGSAPGADDAAGA